MVDGRVYPKSDFIKILRSSTGYGKGTGIISENGMIFATAYNTIKYENSVVKKGGNKKGFFTSQQQQTKATMDLVKSAWAKMQTNSQKIEDNVCVLNAGMDFKEVSNTAEEMQLNQNKASNSADICGLFGVPAGMMSGNVTDKGKQNFITDTLMPLLNTFETAFDSDLLLESEKGKRYFAFDTRELTRGDILQRYNAYAVGKKNGFITLEDIRRLEDLEPIDFPFIQLGLGDVLYNPETGDIYTPNTDMAVNLNQPTGKLPTFKKNEETEPGEPELRFNPYHDPVNGRFTTSDGGGSGAFLYSKGGKQSYVYNTEKNKETPEYTLSLEAREKLTQGIISHSDQDNDRAENHMRKKLEQEKAIIDNADAYIKLGYIKSTQDKWFQDHVENANSLEAQLNYFVSERQRLKSEHRASVSELRFNPNHGKDGKFTSGSGLTSGGKSVKMSYKERKRVSSQIAADFPNLKADGEVRSYENRNHFYQFTVNEFGSYNFLVRMKIVGNEDKINNIRRKYKNG